jgi:hypothetical protein
MILYGRRLLKRKWKIERYIYIRCLCLDSVAGRREIIIGLKKEVFREAGRIKSKYKIPLGDTILVGNVLLENGHW